MPKEQTIETLSEEAKIQTIAEENSDASGEVNQENPAKAPQNKKQEKLRMTARQLKMKLRKTFSFVYRLTPFELTTVILGILIALILISGFAYLYSVALRSAKSVPKNGIIISNEDKTWLTQTVNAAAPLPAEFAVNTSAVTGATGVQVDSRITKETTQLLDDLRKGVSFSGEDVSILAGYTSIQAFTDLYNSTVNNLVNEGHSYEEAVALTNQTVNPPGTDEHSTGLLINFGLGGTIDPVAFKTSASYNWLQENAWKYGFIERFPEGKEEATQHPADPTSFRYVGRTIARAIHESGQTLEEYNAAVAQAAAEQAAAEQADAAAREQVEQQNSDQPAQDQAQPAQETQPPAGQ